MVLAIAAFVYNGFTDNYYKRFSSEKQNSLIVGSSRAAQGINPAYFNDHLNRFEGPLYNYAFTMSNSKYGNVYNQSIKRKLNSNVSNGIYILEVSPWSLAYDTELNPKDDTTKYPEINNFLGKVNNTSSNPNIEYMMSETGIGYKALIAFGRKFLFKESTKLNDNGWLELQVGDLTEKTRKAKTEQKLKAYTKSSKTHKISSNRLNSLQNLASYLSGKGNVYLVRMPLDRSILNMENRAFNNFESFMKGLPNVQYIDLNKSNSKYTFTDGNHVDAQGTKLASEDLVKYIMESN